MTEPGGAEHRRAGRARTPGHGEAAKAVRHGRAPAMRDGDDQGAGAQHGEGAGPRAFGHPEAGAVQVGRGAAEPPGPEGLDGGQASGTGHAAAQAPGVAPPDGSGGGSAAAGDGDVEPAVAGALLGDVDVDVLGLGVLQIALLAELAADAGLLVAAEGVPGVEEVVVVDPDRAGAQALGHPHGAGRVAAPDGAGQAVPRVVGHGDRVVVVVDTDDGQDRPEDLLLGDAEDGRPGLSWWGRYKPPWAGTHLVRRWPLGPSSCDPH